ncbi:MAG TPA: galactokinase family protein [Gemmatimonadaceae bacterium]|nr:galactokinase family protein [Gemmatimonadaceae bacterium]
MRSVGSQLRAAGMADREAAAKQRLFARCLDALPAPGHGAERIPDGLITHGREPRYATDDGDDAPWLGAFFIPGRIELLGKHTDYAGGRSLLCAVERGFVALVRPRTDRIVRVIDTARAEAREVTLAPDAEISSADWAAYVAAAARRLARNFASATRGADIAFASDLPPASGMSSSSALTTMVVLALGAVNRLSEDLAYKDSIGSREDLAGYLGTVENGRSFGALAGDAGVGTFGGSEDHTAILCCRSGFVSRYSFAPIRAEGEVPLPAAQALVVAYSGIAAEKGAAAMAKYNRLASAAERIVEQWNAAMNRTDGSLAAVVESAPDALDRLRDVLGGRSSSDFPPSELSDRLDQFVLETYDVIPSAFEALAGGDLAAFGALVDRSQEGAERLLRNQVPETIALARLARDAGAHAASAFGAGFGGSVWGLVDASDAEEFSARWRAAYGRAFPDAAARSEIIVTRPGPAAMPLVIDA